MSEVSAADQIAVASIFGIDWMSDTFGKELEAINMDCSFMIPGWIGVITSTIVAYGLAQVYF